MSITKRLYLVAGLVAILAIAFSGATLTSHLTSAQGPTPTPAAQTADEQEDADEAAEHDTDDVQEPELNGSISVDEAQYEGLSEADEAVALASLATITPEQASAAAQAEVPGDVQGVELDSENGSLIYSVKIGDKEVKVDAGTGAVLHVESEGPED